MKKDLLLVVDIQNVYLPGYPWACPSINKKIDKIKILLDFGIPAVFTRFVPPKSVGTWENYNKKYSDINSNKYLGEIVSELKLYTNKYPLYDKSSYSSWTDEVKREAQGYHRIILCGVVAECCILSTLLSIIDSGKEIVYLTDCIAGKNVESEQMVQRIAENFSPIHVKIMDSKMYYKSLCQ